MVMSSLKLRFDLISIISWHQSNFSASPRPKLSPSWEDRRDSRWTIQWRLPGCHRSRKSVGWRHRTAPPCTWNCVCFSSHFREESNPSFRSYNFMSSVWGRDRIMLEPPSTLAGNIVFNTMLSADCLMTKMRRVFIMVKLIWGCYSTQWPRWLRTLVGW